MFETRVSQSWGASASILQDFLLEQLAADDGTGIAWFLARRKASGKLVWLKCQLNHVDSLLLDAEAEVWQGLSHPNILSPVEILRKDAVTALVFPWAAEQPCDQVERGSISGAASLRIALGLVRAVQYLQSVDAPVAHNRISESEIWLTNLNHWPRLSGFDQARRNAPAEELEQDRRDCWQAVQRVVAAGSATLSDRIQKFAAKWLSGGNARAQEFTYELEREFVAGITSGYGGES